MALSMRLALSASLALPALASAQRELFPDSSRYAVSINFGRFDYDLGTDGKANAFALRVERPMSKYAIAEGSIMYARPLDPAGDPNSYWIPELQVQAQLPLGVVAPYLGLGGGVAWAPSADRGINSVTQFRSTDPTFSASAGLRGWFTPAVGARIEMRLRGIGGEFQGSATELTVGGVVRLRE